MARRGGAAGVGGTGTRWVRFAAAWASFGALPLVATADRYGLVDESERGGNAGDLLLPLILCAGSYFLLLDSWVRWTERRATGTPVEKPVDGFGWAIRLVGYGIAGFMIAIPPMLVTKFLFGADAGRALAAVVTVVAFAALTYLRRTGGTPQVSDTDNAAPKPGQSLKVQGGAASRPTPPDVPAAPRGKVLREYDARLSPEVVAARTEAMRRAARAVEALEEADAARPRGDNDKAGST